MSTSDDPVVKSKLPMRLMLRQATGDLLYLVPSFICIAHYVIDALIAQPAIFDYPI